MTFHDAILAALSDSPAGLTWGQLAGRLGVARACLTDPLMDLIDRGLLAMDAVPVEGEPGELTPGLALTKRGEAECKHRGPAG